MTKMVAFAGPILPGKKEQWQRFIDQLNGPRRAEYDASRARVGAYERAYLQQNPDGSELVIVTLEGIGDQAGVLSLFDQDDEFSRWFAQEVIEIHGFDPREPLPGPLPQLSVESTDRREANNAG